MTLPGLFSISGRHYGNARVTYNGSQTSTSSSNSITWSNVPIGDAYPDRMVVMLFGTMTVGGTVYYADTLSIAGTNANEIVYADGSDGTNNRSLEIWQSNGVVPTGTTATVVTDIGTGNSNGYSWLASYSVYGASQQNEWDWYWKLETGTGLEKTGIWLLEGGFSIAAAIFGATSPTITWSSTGGWTKDADISNGSYVMSVGSVQRTGVFENAKVDPSASSKTTGDVLVVTAMQGGT